MLYLFSKKKNKSTNAWFTSFKLLIARTPNILGFSPNGPGNLGILEPNKSN